jgi:aspartate/methionine/tyrosine aminotransferase
LLFYGDHKGKPALRELIADEGNLNADDVLVTPGAAAALFIVGHSITGERRSHGGRKTELRHEY